VVAAVSFTWLAMVLAISFLEAPATFRAPGVTVRLGVEIGRVVFRVLNRVELVFLVLVIGVLVIGALVIGALVIGPVAIAPQIALLACTAALAALLAVQLGLVRPALNRRSDRVLAGEEMPRSGTHLVYVALERSRSRCWSRWARSRCRCESSPAASRSDLCEGHLLRSAVGAEWMRRKGRGGTRHLA
jgi:hypothetical protein